MNYHNYFENYNMKNNYMCQNHHLHYNNCSHNYNHNYSFLIPPIIFLLKHRYQSKQLYEDELINLSLRSSYVVGGFAIVGVFSSQFAGVNTLCVSLVCKAIRILRISLIFLPISFGYIRIVLIFPYGSIMYTFLI